MLRAFDHGPVTRLSMTRTFLGRPLRKVQAYLVDGLLIDTGCPGTASDLLAWCRGRVIERVVNTHVHEDHCGGNRVLQRRLGLPVSVPAASLDTLARPPRLPLYRRVVWGQPRGGTADPLGAVVETSRYRFEVIPTPGHAPDHVCLFEQREGWLFGGDLFLHERARYLRPTEDARVILESLYRVLALRPRRLFCGHAGVVEDACGALERKIAYWEELAERAQALRAAGHSLHAIRDELLGAEGWMGRATGGDFSKINLIRSLLGENLDAT